MKLSRILLMPCFNVLQYVPCWLPQTQLWLYEQFTHLPDSFIPHIVCEELQNLDQFNVQHLYCRNRVPRIIRLQRRLAWRFGLIPFDSYIDKVAKKIGISIMHSHWGHIAWMNLRVASRLKVPHIASFYGIDVRYAVTGNPLLKKLYKELFLKIDLVLALGPKMASELEDLGCPWQKIIVHHLGVDLTLLPFQPRKWDIGQPLRVLIAGTFKVQKGIPYALDALSKIKGYADLEITIIGDATNSDRSQNEKKQIMDTVQRLELNSMVSFLGYQPYKVLISEAYKNHIFLSPSITSSEGDMEGTPITIAEMAATGIPIVSTFHSDIPEIIHHGKTGWLAKEKDADDLAACLHFLITNHESWEPFLKKGRDHIEKDFDVQRQATKLAEIYKRFIS